MADIALEQFYVVVKNLIIKINFSKSKIKSSVIISMPKKWRVDKIINNDHIFSLSHAVIKQIKGYTKLVQIEIFLLSLVLLLM